jgi:hypothetical protein
MRAGSHGKQSLLPVLSHHSLQASGVEYEDMLFFDNERWNITGAPQAPHVVVLPAALLCCVIAVSVLMLRQ